MLGDHPNCAPPFYPFFQILYVGQELLVLHQPDSVVEAAVVFGPLLGVVAGCVVDSVEYFSHSVADTGQVWVGW